MIEKPRGKRITKFKGAEQEGVMRTIPLKPLNENQKLYLSALEKSNQIIVCGFSGTGKTYMAATYAANMYANKQIDKIILTRPNVSVGKDLGYFPGTLEEKFAPWAAPVLDVLQEQLGAGVVETGVKNGNILMAPLSTMRGRSFHDAFIILDECFKGDTEVLTEGGFVRLDSLDKGAKVAQFDGESFSFVKPIRKVEKDYDGNMVEHYRDRFSMIATENHDAVYHNAKGKYIKRKFSEDIVYDQTIPVSKLQKDSSKYDSEVVLACAIQADGSLGVRYSSAGNPTHYWSVQVSRERKITRLEECLNDLGIGYSKYAKDQKGRVRFYIPYRDIKYLSGGKSKNFDLQEILKHGAQTDFLFESLLWDGHKNTYCSTNKHNIDVIQACAHLSGYAANFGVTLDKRDIFKREPKPYYRLNISERNHLSPQKFKKDVFKYTGKVYCVTVPSGMIIVRQSGTVFISGNCQNTTTAEIKMFLTRIGKGCKVVINGDIKQSDIQGQSGLSKIMHLAKKYSLPIPVIEFGVEDIVRSDICKQWIIAFEAEGL